MSILNEQRLTQQTLKKYSLWVGNFFEPDSETITSNALDSVGLSFNPKALGPGGGALGGVELRGGWAVNFQKQYC